MPRGFKVDYQATRQVFGHTYRPGGSFVSQLKIIHEESELACRHLLLARDDPYKAEVRAEIFRRNRVAHGGINRCEKCNQIVSENGDEYQIPVYDPEIGPAYVVRGEWDHIRNKAGERCDCPENGRVACRDCHKKRHPQTQFGAQRKSLTR